MQFNKTAKECPALFILNKGALTTQKKAKMNSVLGELTLYLINFILIRKFVLV
jgi:hypothetical protein